ncbi:MAG: MBL fold metallo-hydrolase [Bacteroidales bacterium]|nr:MBL fold metallo-hydrolase [Bacteroidales bacterium]MBN2819937.1 MBL fold metallo-hydrolase [Bacteroidales bacterium]
MKLTILTENQAGAGFLAEHGLSYLIESGGDRILFDTGSSDVFLKNASKLGFDIQKDIDIVILSHGHWDHGNGLQYLRNKTLITHPGVFMNRFRKHNQTPIGLYLSREEIEEYFELLTTQNSYKIANNLIFLGEIPRINDFEAQTTTFIDEDGNPDFVFDDSAIAVVENNELIVITGCSHSGICNIVDYAMKVTGLKSVKAVIGGFHLKYNNKQTQQTIQYFKNLNVKNLYPSHCTELEALTAFSAVFNISALKTGMILEF